MIMWLQRFTLVVPSGFGVGLSCHIPQSQGKRGLVTMPTMNCTGDIILSCPIRFVIFSYCLVNTWLVTHTHTDRQVISVVHDNLFVIIAFCANSSLY